MPDVFIAPNLARFFPSVPRTNFAVPGTTIAAIIANLDCSYPGIGHYIVDDTGSLRRHVNVFIGEELMLDRTRLSDRVASDALVSIFQALSGG